MKKTLAWMAASVALAFLLITLVHRRSAGDPEHERGPGDAGRQRITRFWSLYNQANALRSQGEFERAAAVYREALRLDPKHEDSLYNLGTSLKEAGQYGEAVAAFQRLVEINPSSSRGWSELGNTLATPLPGAPLDFDQARRAYERSIAINREEAGPFLRLGMLELNRGDSAAALRYLETAAGFGSPEGNFLAGYACFVQNRHREAVPHFAAVLNTLAHERKIAGRGVLSEGDVLPAAGKPMTALERAGIKSLLFLYWSSLALGGYPAGIPDEFRLRKSARAAAQFQFRITAPELSRDRQGAVPASCTAALQQLQPANVQTQGAAGCALGDYDRDGRLDLFVFPWQRNVALYSNQGGGKFSDTTRQAGLGGIRGRGFSTLFFDYDRDGWLDLLVTLHAPYEEVVRSLLQPNVPAQATPRLFRNRQGVFEEVTKQVGFTRAYGTMQALATDLDGDGWPDLVFANGSLDALRLEPSVVLRNVGGRRFDEWSYIPSFDKPANFVGVVSVSDRGKPLLFVPGREPAWFRLRISE